jgi:hypothetical protein
MVEINFGLAMQQHFLSFEGWERVADVPLNRTLAFLFAIDLVVVEETIKQNNNSITPDESKQKNIYSDYIFCNGSTIIFFIG